MSDKRNSYHSRKKSNYYSQAQAKRKQYLDPGQRGFLLTCNFREKDCVREGYNILNQYADQLYDSDGNKKAPDENTTLKSDITSSTKTDTSTEDQEDVDKDISSALEDEVNALKTQSASNVRTERRFQSVETGASNCIFIKTTLSDPVELAVSVVRDVAETKIQKTRYLLRLVPVEVVCRANIKDLTATADKLFDKHFVEEPKSFSIMFNHRYNNSLSRDEVIKELAELVCKKNLGNKVNLSDADLSVIVEVIKGICLISVVPDYLKLKKYNLLELCGVSADKKPETDDNNVMDQDAAAKEAIESITIDSDEPTRRTEGDPKPEPITIDSDEPTRPTEGDPKPESITIDSDEPTRPTEGDPKPEPITIDSDEPTRPTEGDPKPEPITDTDAPNQE